MSELRLLFTKSGGEFTLRLQAAGAVPGAPQPFAPFLTDGDFEDLRWYLEEYMDLPDGGSVVRAQRVESALGDWGRRLFAAVFDTEEGRPHLARLLADQPSLLTIATQDTTTGLLHTAETQACPYGRRRVVGEPHPRPLVQACR